MTIYIGNLPFSATTDEIQALFEQYGEVSSVKLITDRATGKPKGFGFVEMEDEDAQNAIESLEGSEFGGRNIRVNEARERSERPSQPRGGGRQYGGGGQRNFNR
ncbi:MAG: RNA recognition motif domain-containing protein [Bacteroidota bacterium]